MWDMKDEISVFVDHRSWNLEIRKRKDLKRTTIHKGWIQFRDDFQLHAGDVCRFTFKDDCVRKFSVEVNRAI